MTDKTVWSLSIGIYFEPRDLWIGAYWNRTPGGLDVWVCLLTCLPIKISWKRS